MLNNSKYYVKLKNVKKNESKFLKTPTLMKIMFLFCVLFTY